MEKLEKLLSELERDPSFLNNVTRWEKIPASEGDYRDFPEDLHASLSSSLKERGIDRLYSHQEEAYRQARSGKDSIIVTPTASGKTLCYNLPVIQTLLEKPEGRALYIFPTKALSQDQQAELNGLVEEGDLKVKVSTYDGDTPSSLRVSARESGRIVITNPDMLHSGVLPNHPKWIKFLKALEYIVIDEVHIYRGIFGSHMTNLIRRLLRITRFYGANPKFICCSATIGNPDELAERIIGREVTLIDRNGAPRGEKHMILYNPPLVDAVQGIRKGITKEARSIAYRFLVRGIKTIVFARSRVRTELIASYINKSLSNFFTDNNRIRVEAYRGGFLPGERRAIEKGLRDGDIHGVVSTNALELGIDIGGLDVSILSGIPTSIASSWQQSGRAGRQKTLSVSFLIASVSPTDQYLITHPEYFFGKSPEKGFIDPDNLYILMDHLKCAVFELPFKDGDSLSGEDETELLEHLESEGVLRHTSGRWYWADRGYPAEEISLRSATNENVVIINTTKGKNEVIGEMDKPSAKELIFDEAVYLHRGEQFQVQKLDLANLKCYVEESSLNFYTDSIVKTDIKVLLEDNGFRRDGVDQIIGDVLVRSQISKYKKLKFSTNENVGYGEIFLPEEEMHTRGILLCFHPETPSGEVFSRLDTEQQMQVTARMGTLMKNVAPIFLLCDSRDIGVAERLKDPHTDMPTLYIYDNHPGGTGLSEAFTGKLPEIIEACRELTENCPCETGCPSCVGAHEDEVSTNAKEAVLKVLVPWSDFLRERRGR
ncbi:MAG: DEAD/DEAH box helicase [Spirochaetales bacterium]|nr:DEAD/DEAH box helicase [Spirochaetales bacterium]